MADDNILHLPTPLERLAVSIRTLLKRDAQNYEEWLEIQEGLCLTLAEAREQIPADIAFSQWCHANGFGEEVLDPHTRAAAIAMGREPEALCECLNATSYRSLRRIHKHDWPRYGTRAIPTRHTNTDAPLCRPTEQFEKACAAIDDLRSRGEPVTYQSVRDLAGIGGTALRRALAYKEAEALLNPLTPADMRATERKRYELALRNARAQIREELKDEVYRELDVFVRHNKERVEKADKILAAYAGVMSREVYRRIKACLHPDHNTFTHAAEALRLFSGLEAVLVKPEAPTLSGPPLPATAAELMARRRQNKRQ